MACGAVDDLTPAVLEAFANIDGHSVRKATNSVLKGCNLCINFNEPFKHR